MGNGADHLDASDETDLDAALLRSSIQVETNWHVLTGAPCSGKTTLIEMLADQGFATAQEAGRVYVEQELRKGRTFDEIFASEEARRSIEAMQRETESRLDPQQITFLDRALPDCLAFYRLKGMDPNEILPDCLKHRYATVFLLDPLPLDLDGARPDDLSVINFLDQQLVADYAALGYPVIRVPVIPPVKRLDLILNTIIERGLL